jgi:sigma-B regulation protein RsbU (phosphoserine phosphatase)
MKYAHPVGGDFADAAALNGHIYACIGDISGKGTPAALFSMLLKHLLDSAHRRGLRSREVVAALNEGLSQALPPEKFVTFFYVEISPDNGQVEYVNAGHPEGIIYRHGAHTTDLIGPNTSLLGSAQVSTEVTTSTLWLQPGDALVLYTDGATESKGPDGKQLGDEFMVALVEEFGKMDAQEMADAIVRRVEEVTDERWRDDLTVLCIKATY